METRRRVPRQHAAWKGLYLIEGRQPSTEWQECEVPRGYVGLEAEGWRIEFRNVKLKTLENK